MFVHREAAHFLLPGSIPYIFCNAQAGVTGGQGYFMLRTTTLSARFVAETT
jgi:hypothetical protein